MVGSIVAALLLAEAVSAGPVVGALICMVTVPLLFSTVQLVVMSRGWGQQSARVAARVPQPCPRCDDTPRGPSGWCWPCFGVLQQAPVTAGHPLWSDAAIPDGSDATIDRVLAVFAPIFAVWGWITTDEPVNTTREFWGNTLRGLRRVFPDFCSETEAAFVDPADPAVAWTRTRDRGHPRFGGPALDTRTITRYRFEDGLAVELRIGTPMRVA